MYSNVHERTEASICVMVNEMGVVELRAQLADVLHQVVVRGETIYITNRGRRVAAIVSLADAELLERLRRDNAKQGPPGD